MNRVILFLILLVLTGCQSAKTTVIAPESSETGQPQIVWVKKGNVLHLQLKGEALDL